MIDQDSTSPSSAQNTASKELFVLLLCLLAGISLGGIAGSFVLYTEIDSIWSTKLLLAIQQIAIFIVPSVLFTFILFRHKALESLGLRPLRSVRLVFLASISIFAIAVFIQYSNQLNQLIPMPDWMLAMEQESEALIQQLLEMNGISDLLVNLLLIAILPAIGEELLFRGVLQTRLSVHFKNPHLAIWISAIIFSTIHFQFQGFFPRMFLGALLGYLYWLGGSLWLAILVHFLNNGFQVLMYYLFLREVTDFDIEADIELHWLAALFSLGLTIGILWIMKKIRRKESKETSEELP